MTKEDLAGLVAAASDPANAAATLALISEQVAAEIDEHEALKASSAEQAKQLLELRKANVLLSLKGKTDTVTPIVAEEPEEPPKELDDMTMEEIDEYVRAKKEAANGN